MTGDLEIIMWKSLVLACCLPLVACSSNDTERTVAPSTSPAPQASKAVEVILQENTQGTFADVKLGVGNIWEEPYNDAAGNETTGFTAGVWIFVRNDDAKNTTLRVHPGQTFTANGMKFEVKAVNRDSLKLALLP